MEHMLHHSTAVSYSGFTQSHRNVHAYINPLKTKCISFMQGPAEKPDDF